MGPIGCSESTVRHVADSEGKRKQEVSYQHLGTNICKQKMVYTGAGYDHRLVTENLYFGFSFLWS